MRLLLVDDCGGRLAALAAGVASLSGLRGFRLVLACSQGAPVDDPVIAQVLAEVGLGLAPVVQPLASIASAAGDRRISLGETALEGADHWPARIAPLDAHPLVQRSAARIARDAFERHLLAL